ncbi:MAG UNVERIFIED_CONTAM: virB8 family protein [Rickettsiaceae bacterium]|jgi:type IV secretion system protein VirB8
MTQLFHDLKNKIWPEKNPENTSSKLNVKSWFEERYEIVLIQRNLVFLIAAFCLIGIAAAVFGITKISLSKEFDPFVIQIENDTGAAKVVNPISSEVLSGNDSLARYFIKKYVIARETYNPVDFDTRARKIVRLLSNGQIYSVYIGYIKNKDNDPTISYGQKNTTYLTVRSWSKLDAKRYVLRFAISETLGDKKTTNKIAIVDYQYVPMSLAPEDEDINPVGFQITGYRVDDDQS